MPFSINWKNQLAPVALALLLLNRVMTYANEAQSNSAWAGATMIGTGTAWEPTVAAAPSSSTVYSLWLRFPASNAVLRVSPDGGQTWGTVKSIYNTGNAQYNAVIKAAPGGVVYVTLIDKNSIMVGKSTDHGETWSFKQIGATSDGVDKPWIGTDVTGTNVYVAYEDYRGLLIAASHDSGASFGSPVLAESASGYSHFPYGLTVLPNGTAIVSTTAYPNRGVLPIETFRTTNGGMSWTKIQLDSVYLGTHWYLSSETTVTSDVTGSNVVAVYSGATANKGNGHIYTRRSTDGGVTWSARQELTPGTGNAGFPAAAAGSTGSIKVAWQEQRSRSWNTYHRSSTDGGVTWGPEQKISDATSGASYKSAAGYGGPYGDNFSIDVDPAGHTIAVWGEGGSFTSNLGNVWFNRQTG